MNLKKTCVYIPFFAALFAGLYFISFNVTGHSLEFYPGDLIDGRFNAYLLEHVYRFFTGKTMQFWNAPFMFPEENVITYSDNLLGSAPLYCIFRLFGAGTETAFQLWYLAVTVLNFTCCYILLYYIFKNHYAAACGALVFAFSMALHSQVGHAQTFPRYAVPLAIWMLLRYNDTLKPRYFFAALFFLVYQLYCGIYLGFLLAVPFTVLFVLIVVLKWGQHLAFLKRKKWIALMLLSTIVNVLLLLPLLLPYCERSKQIGLYSFEYVLPSVPTPGSYFFSWKGSLLWDWLSETCLNYPAFWDHEIFAGGFALFGFISVALILVTGVFYPKINQVFNMNVMLRTVIFSGIVTLAFFLRINNFSLYKYIHILPGFGSMRALQRIINIELVFFSVAVACLVNPLTKKSGILSTVVTLVLITAIVADNYINKGFIHQHEKTEWQQRVNELYKKIEGTPESKIISYEPDTMISQPLDYQLDAMLAAQRLGCITMNGYSATSPGGYGPYWVKPCEETRRIWLERKEQRGVAVVVVK